MPRPSTPLISRRRATEIALEIVDEFGLDKLSLAKVAQRMGVKSPSLYYHFRDKEELLSEVARLLLLKVPEIRPDDRPPEEWIVSLCVSTRRTILEHPNAAPLMLEHFPRNVLLAAYESSARVYDYPVEYQIAILEGTEKLTFGSALFAAAAIARRRDQMPPVDPTKLPNLSRALAGNPLDEDALFEETLRIYLAGAAARIRGGEMGRPIHRDSVAA